MKFIYKIASEEREVELHHWQEIGLYIEGFDSQTNTSKKYFKFNILKFTDDGYRFLKNPFPAVEDIRAHLSRFSSKCKNSDNPFVTEIYLSGFTPDQRELLVFKAKAFNLKMVNGFTPSLKFMIVDERIGPLSIRNAMEKGLIVLKEDEYHHLLDTGVLPD